VNLITVTSAKVALQKGFEPFTPKIRTHFFQRKEDPRPAPLPEALGTPYSGDLINRKLTTDSLDPVDCGPLRHFYDELNRFIGLAVQAGISSDVKVAPAHRPICAMQEKDNPLLRALDADRHHRGRALEDGPLDLRSNERAR